MDILEKKNFHGREWLNYRNEPFVLKEINITWFFRLLIERRENINKKNEFDIEAVAIVTK